MARNVEVAAGTLATILGLAGLAFAVFGPTYRGESATVTIGGAVSVRHETASLWEMGIQPVTVIYLAVMLSSFLLVGFAAWMHAVERVPRARWLLWSSVVVLWLGTALGFASVGILMLPGTLMAFIAVVASTQRSDRREPDAA